MKYSIDLGLFERDSHNPSFFSLVRSLGEGARDLVDFCVPCNPYFPTPEMFDRLARELSRTLKYYPSDRGEIERELCAFLNLDPRGVVLANGSTELISWVDQLFIRESLFTPVPTFGRWTDQPAETGKRVNLYALESGNGFALDVDDFIGRVQKSGACTVAVCNPNNPTGTYLPRREIVKMLDAFRHLDLVVIDESFIDFVDAEKSPSVADEAFRRSNVLVLKSLGKNFGLHGIRFGYSVSHPRLAERLRRALPPWNVNSVAEAVIFSLAPNRAAYEESLQKIHADRRFMELEIGRLGVTVYPSQANFLLIKLPPGIDARRCRNYLLTEHGCFIRECSNKLGMGDGFLRAATHPASDVMRLSRGLEAFLQNEESGSLRNSISSAVDSRPRIALR